MRNETPSMRGRLSFRRRVCYKESMTPRKAATKDSASASASAKGTEPMYLVFGTDDFSALRKAEEIVQSLCPPAERDFGLEVIQPGGEEKTAEPVCQYLRNTMQAILTVPFLGGKKTVFLNGAPFFDPLTDPGRLVPVKNETARLVELLKNGLPPGVSLVILAGKVNKTTSFYKTFAAKGQTFEFNEAVKDREASADFLPRMEEWLTSKGLTLRGDARSALIGRTGYNLRLVEMELEKLSIYLGDRHNITVEDVQQMVGSVRTNQFWEFSDAYCTTRMAYTLDILHRLLAQNTQPVALIANLQGVLRDMAVLSDCLKRGWAHVIGSDWPKFTWSLPEEGETLLSSLESDPRKLSPFRLGHMAVKADRLPPARWFRWFNAAVDAQVAMTGGEGISAETILELFVIRTLGELKVSR